METNGQTYFMASGEVPEADRRRYEEAVSQDTEKVRQQIEQLKAQREVALLEEAARQEARNE